MASFKLYGAFTKIEEQPDGTLYVEGVASSESVDSQGEVIKASAMRAALPDYLRFPALREMHQPWAAGKTLGAAVDDEGKTTIATKVVDAEAVRKVKEGVYRGFSIGGTVPPGGRNKDDAKIIETIKLAEISLVDRPANPDAVITLVKIDQPPPLQTSAVAEPVRKGMYQVAWAAELIGQLSSLAADTQWEAEYECDSSAVPGRLKALCAEFGAILRDLVAEETAELVGSAPEAQAVEMAEKPGAMKKSERLAAIAKAFLGAARGEAAEKAGARFSAATKADLQAHHDELGKCAKAVGDLHDAFGKLGWQDDAKDKESAAVAADLRKAVESAAAQVTELKKRAEDAEAATAAAGAALEKVMGERDAAAKGLAAARTQLEAKGVLRLVAVEKKADTGEAGEAEPTDTLSLIRKVHQGGGTAR